MKKTDVAVVGATGIVGQRLVKLLVSHPNFRLSALFAGERSAGKTFCEAIEGRRVFQDPFPQEVENMQVLKAEPERIAKQAALAFCAVKLPKEETRLFEESLAKRETVVISLNSANRTRPDVPMIIPEINLRHLSVLPAQKRRLGAKRGFIVAKCNCALLSFVPLVTPLLPFRPREITVTTLQAISGAGKIPSNAPELSGNVLPFISGEEKKCEEEPKKIWGSAEGGHIKNYPLPLSIRAQCFRVPLPDGHFASSVIAFEHPPSREEVLSAWEEFNARALLPLPSSPQKFITYFEEDARPQPLFDLYAQGGMGIAAGRLRTEGGRVSFVGLSHNTLRGAAGGAVLLAEALLQEGYLS